MKEETPPDSPQSNSRLTGRWRELFNKGILTGIFALLFLGALVWVYVQDKTQNERELRIAAESQKTGYKIALTGLDQRLDTLVAQNKQLNLQLNDFVKEYKGSKAQEQKIISSYDNVYKKIRSSRTATEQVSDTRVLLAKLAGLPSARD